MRRGAPTRSGFSCLHALTAKTKSCAGLFAADFRCAWQPTKTRAVAETLPTTSSPRSPWGVTSTVCSHWAERLRSFW